MENIFDDNQKKSPFEVPEGYFENFEEKMMARIREEEASAQTEENQPIVLNSQKRKTSRWFIGAAAAVALVIVGAYAFVNIQNDINNQAVQIAEAATEDDYYDLVNEMLESEEIEEALAQINFEE